MSLLCHLLTVFESFLSLSLQLDTLERAMASLSEAERTAAVHQVEREEGLSKQHESLLQGLRNTLTADFKVRESSDL